MLIKTRAELEKTHKLFPREKAWFDSPQEKEFGFQVTPYYLSLAGKEKNDPIRRQCIPLDKEFKMSPGELADPIGDAHYTKTPALIHRYPDRALLLVTDQCAAFCRFCFRRHYSGKGRGAITEAELRKAASYLKRHPQISELILSGGDPLTLSDKRLFEIIDVLRTARPDLTLRLSTRIPAVLPSRITRNLALGLNRRRPVWLVVHINHARELTPESDKALRCFALAGIPLLSQTVLLAGINDTAAVLEELFRCLVSQGVKPYYLFQADLARGTAHFRVPLSRGRAIMKALSRRLSPLALPVYAMDLGDGKIPLNSFREENDT